MTNHLTEAQERERFEAVMLTQGYGTKPRICSEDSPCPGEYANQYWELSWRIWRAAKADATTSAESEAKAVSSITATAPERIWLNVFSSADGEDLTFPEDTEGVTWADQDVGDLDVKYIRADLAARPVASAESEATAREAFEARRENSKSLLWKRGGTVFAEDVPESDYVDAGVQRDWLLWLDAWNKALAARPVAQADAGAADDLVKRLRNTPNWLRESYGSWKDCVTEYDRAPFEAADQIERLTLERNAAVSAHEAAVRAGFSFRGRVIELSGEKARLQEALAASAQATQAVEPVAAEEDKKRLDYLDAAANEMLLEFGFEIDGGVYLRIDAPGHGGTDIREKNSARAAIDSAMVVAPC